MHSQEEMLSPETDSSADGAEIAPDLRLGNGLRMTRQRREVFGVLTAHRDHPTAAEVHARARERMPNISLATVYNCLETLTSSGLVKQVTTDRGSSRYCPNLKEHAHFCCEGCGAVCDVEPREAGNFAELWSVPGDHRVSRVEVVIKGICAACRADQGS